MTKVGSLAFPRETGARAARAPNPVEALIARPIRRSDRHHDCAQMRFELGTRPYGFIQQVFAGEIGRGRVSRQMAAEAHTLRMERRDGGPIHQRSSFAVGGIPTS